MPLGKDPGESLVTVFEENGAAGSVLEPGKSLVLTDFSPPAISAGERLIRLAYRLGVPSST
ncbi:MAG: hypothetical protein WBA55_07700, partial [Allopontixanthobacter sediminis]